MKTETIKKANELLETMREVDQVLEKLVKVDYLDGIEFSLYVDNHTTNRKIILTLNRDGSLSNLKFLSTDAKNVLSYLTKGFKDQFINLINAELGRLQKELDNLKDE